VYRWFWSLKRAEGQEVQLVGMIMVEGLVGWLVEWELVKWTWGKTVKEV